jgi:hypothetical protein
MRSGLVFFTGAVIFLSSCATLRDLSPEKPLIAQTPQALVPVWQEFAPQADGALAFFAGKTVHPRLELRALRIDLAAPQLRIVVAAGGRNENTGDTVLSTKVSSFVRDNALLAGINALPFDPVSGTEGEYRENVGIVIADGVLLSPPHPVFAALVFYDDARTAIIPQSRIESAAHISNAAGGFHQILINGELSEHAENNSSRHPRSAAGISADGKYLYLLVVDGRRLASIGSTEAETAAILKQLGAWNGINFDGGGSSSLALRFPDGTVRPVNTPIHNNIPGTERAVAGCIGVGLAQ